MEADKFKQILKDTPRWAPEFRVTKDLPVTYLSTLVKWQGKSSIARNHHILYINGCIVIVRETGEELKGYVLDKAVENLQFTRYISYTYDNEGKLILLDKEG